MSWNRTLKLDQIPIGKTRTVEADGESLLLCRVASDEVYAIEDTCSHDDGPLDQGSLDGSRIECPRHGAVFDVRTGQVMRMPAAVAVETFPVRVTRDGWVEVSVEDE
jgi:3-phenylpropionate/trans-cinnamate dioxygenase ferredoxin component